jgi:hypothetical protein
MMPRTNLRARVLAAAARVPSRTRAEQRRATWALLVLSVVVAIGVLELLGGCEHARGRPLAVSFAITAGWAAAAALLCWLALARERSTLGRWPFLWLASAAIAPAALFVWMRAFYGTYPEPFERIGYRCAAFTLVCAAAPFAAFLVARRGTEPRRPAELAAIGGVACGAVAGIIVSLWCPLVAPGHALVGHILPLLVLLVGGARLGKGVLGARAPSR